MTAQEADTTFGSIVFETEHYQLRALEKPTGLHVYSLRKDGNKILLPRGSNALIHEALQ